MTWTWDMVEYPMFNNKGESQMNNLKVEVIKKLLMLDTKKELIKVRECISDGISNELDQDDRDQVEFKKWKESKQKEDTDEIPF